ncbi:hypothetical protein KC19_2G211100 [Ceratodon purpureus]|uniref:Uncharacterized protein n=1 Tax=Ceratodon purpureus TaxID=3225 RepID=A0A8T0J083_CERPU|nr:hypothetical protein KC19_2G211100 [Ceratodon purpureus]
MTHIVTYRFFCLFFQFEMHPQLVIPEARGEECPFKRRKLTAFVSFHTMCMSSSSLSRVLC